MRRLASLVALAVLLALPAAAHASNPMSLDPLRTDRGSAGEPGRIVDVRGREVLLRGVNVNALGEYWRGNRFPPTFPLTRADARGIAERGWNVVRLVVSWSRVEPRPGAYDRAYLGRVRRAIRLFAAQGVYTIVDMHQDAWGPTLAARPGETCPGGAEPAIGWDGAPGWATLVPDTTPRCAFGGTREASPAVRAAWGAFWSDAAGPGPGAAGIRSRFVAAWRALARSVARERGLAGFDVLNEPNAIGDGENAALGVLHDEAIAAIRAAERAAGARRHLILIEPSVLWSATMRGAPPAPRDTREVVYAPHLYSGVFDGSGPPRAEAFATARAEAAALGGLPLLTGEWGADPARAAAPERYFARHQQLQDESRMGAALWLWKTSCGDPHQVLALRRGQDPGIWGPFATDCATNTLTARTGAIDRQLRWWYPQASPGRLLSTRYDERTRTLTVRGRARPANRAALVVSLPGAPARPSLLLGRGFRDLRTQPGPAGQRLLVAMPRGGAWSLRVRR